MIVPVSLQMLIENAVKHNEVSDAWPLSINIKKAGEYIEVSNSIKAKVVDATSTNMGLKNLQQQFAFFSNKEIKIQKTASTFLVKLPLIKTHTA
jgi:LytS/YehU family sensor histidine kinase